MKTKLITLCAFLLIALTCCKRENNYSEFDKSYSEWLKFKSKSQNFYSYTVTTSSFTGVGTETTIEIFNGVAFSRAFKVYSPDPSAPGHKILAQQWREDKEQLNTHQDGAATKTLDEIYDEVKNNWIVKRPGAEIFFETKNNGLISLAGYVENNCQDDCFRGINITAINDLLPLIYIGQNNGQ